MRNLPVLALMAVVGAGAGPCGAEPREWRESEGGNGHAYDVLVAPSGISWENARMIARVLGGDLATAESDAENAFIFSIAVSVEGAWATYPLGRGRSVTLGPWLGALQHPGAQEPGGNWAWITGADLPAKGWWWSEHEPNNHADRAGDENRLCYIGINGMPSPFWNDAEETPRGTGGEPGVRVRSFVVEYTNGKTNR